jgi:NAD(P)-dependent dehydrogenase (short-subunit alcohol dehydrogenase family)
MLKAGIGGDLERWTAADGDEGSGSPHRPFLTMRVVLRRMSSRRYGKIVVTGSLYSVTGDRNLRRLGCAAAKGGVQGPRRSLRVPGLRLLHGHGDPVAGGWLVS